MTLAVSTSELSVLMAFNRATALSCRQLQATTGLADADLQAAIRALSTPPHAVLTGPEPRRGRFQPADVFALAALFDAGGRSTIDVHSTAITLPSGQPTTVSTSQDMHADLVDAAIVSFVKQANQASGRAVQQHVVARCAVRVALAPAFVAQRLRRLVSAGLLLVDSNDIYRVHWPEATPDSDPAPAPLSRTVSVAEPAALSRTVSVADSDADSPAALLRVTSVQQPVAYALAGPGPTQARLYSDAAPGFEAAGMVLQELRAALGGLGRALAISPSLALLVMSSPRVRWDPRYTAVCDCR